MADAREVRGLQELGRTMDLLSVNLERRALRKAGAAGIEVYRKEIRARAPSRVEVGVTGFRKTGKKLKAGKLREPGYLKLHIGRWAKKNADGSWSWLTGPTPSAFYGRFVEGGHLIVHGKALSKAQRKLRQAEFGEGRVPAHPFMRPTFNGKTDEAFHAFADELTKNLGDLVG